MENCLSLVKELIWLHVDPLTHCSENETESSSELEKLNFCLKLYGKNRKVNLYREKVLNAISLAKWHSMETISAYDMIKRAAGNTNNVCRQKIKWVWFDVACEKARKVSFNRMRELRLSNSEEDIKWYLSANTYAKEWKLLCFKKFVDRKDCCEITGQEFCSKL